MKNASVFLLLLASCFSSAELPLIQAAHSKRQKQKIAQLQKRWEVALKEEQKASAEMAKLALEIHREELKLIRRQIDEAEEKEGCNRLFMEEREVLYRLIQEGPSEMAFEAQVELDRILQMITECSDEEKRKF